MSLRHQTYFQTNTQLQPNLVLYFQFCALFLGILMLTQSRTKSPKTINELWNDFHLK
jgi:hypothetical protein